MAQRLRELGSVWNLIADTSFGTAPIYDRIARAVAEDKEVLHLLLEVAPS